MKIFYALVFARMAVASLLARPAAQTDLPNLPTAEDF